MLLNPHPSSFSGDLVLSMLTIGGSMSVWMVSWLNVLDSVISLHTNNNIFSDLVKSDLFILDTSRTLILPEQWVLFLLVCTSLNLVANGKSLWKQYYKTDFAVTLGMARLWSMIWACAFNMALSIWNSYNAVFIAATNKSWVGIS